MKERLKWLCVGVGVMFGMQLIILLIVHNLFLAPHPRDSRACWQPSPIRCRLHGRRVCYWSHGERIEIVEPVAATVVTLAIDVLTTLAGGLSGMFLFSLAFRQGDYGVALAIGGVAVVAALAGALAGERLEAPVESWINQALMILGLAGLVLGPYLVISIVINIPRSATPAFGVYCLADRAVSHHFRKQDEEEEAMSIRPEATRDQLGATASEPENI